MLLPTILLNPIPCGKATGRRTQFGRSTSGRLLPEGRKNADGLLGDAHDAAHGLIVHAHFVEDEEENLSLAVKSQKDFISLYPQIYWMMEQRFSNNSLDLETLREFCKRESF